MKNQLSTFVLLFLFWLFSGCGDNSESLSSNPWPETTTTAKPWTRWWWMGNAVDEENLRWQLEALAKAGMGGVEISPIYGVKGFEDRFIDHLSPEWIDRLGFTLQEADRLGMQVDMIQGTGWPFGGPQVSAEAAACRMVMRTFSLRGGQSLDTPILPEDTAQQKAAILEALLAFNDTGKMQDLTPLVDQNGWLPWQAPAGTWTLYALFSGKTLQKVKRPSPGGAGWVMDHFSREALQSYLEPYGPALADGKGSKLRALFNDSYEVYHADWTSGFLEQFHQKRGYDLRPYVPFLFSKEAHNDTTARLLSDCRETLSELLLENFLHPWSAWARDRGYLTRNQAHGSPGNLLDLYAAADIPECESFNSSPFAIPGLRRDSSDIRFEDPDPVMLKFAASAAHVMGKPLTSSESMTWLGDHFRVALSQCKPEIEQLWLSGVNHVFFHGTTYSPRDEPWPGWKFYAAVNFAPQNTFWPDAAAFFAYITRCQSILQAGEPHRELLIYWPVYDLWGDPEFKPLLRQFKIHDIEEWLKPTPFYQMAGALMDAGYAVDFISDRQLAEATVTEEGIRLPGGTFRALVLPPCNRIPVATFAKLLDLSAAGANLIMPEMPEDVPGWQAYPDRNAQLAELKSAVLAKKTADGLDNITWEKGRILLDQNFIKSLETIDLQGEKLSNGIEFIRRDLSDGNYYYLVNHGAQTVDELVALNAPVTSALLLDPQTGQSGRALVKHENDQKLVRLQLAPGEAVIVRTFSKKKIAAADWPYAKNAGPAIPLAGNWQVHFTEGGPSLPLDTTIGQLSGWNNWNQDAEAFSGTAVYRLTFPFPEGVADDYLLRLGIVRESARVKVNGREVGACWSIPFQIRIGDYLQAGENQLEIAVTNLGANRIRHMDQKKINWKKFYDANIVHVSYQPFDASVWAPMTSGLLGPVELVPLQLD